MRPSPTTSDSAGSEKLTKKGNGASSPYSSPMNRSGTNGDSNVRPAASFQLFEADQPREAVPEHRIADLIVILDEHHRPLAGELFGWASRNPSALRGVG